MRVLRPALLLLALLTLLAGCANGPGGQAASGPGSLAYNGASSGEHSASESCGSRGTLHWSANLGSGSVTVKVLDGKGATAWSKTFSGPGQAAETPSVSGAAGTWTVQATRSGGFSGQYALHLDC